MSGEVSIIITMVAVGVALATFMFAIFRILDRRIDETNNRIDDRFAEAKQHTDERFADFNRRIDETNKRIDKLETTVQTLVKDVGEVKGAVNVIQRGLRMEVAGPAK